MASIARATWFKSSGTTVSSGVIVGWPSTNASIPTGWTRETALDSRYVKQIATSGTNPGTTGGSCSHTHSGGGNHSHSVAAHSHSISGAFACKSACGGGTPINGGVCAWWTLTHSHCAGSLCSGGSYSSGSSNPCLCSTTAEPPNLVVIFIKSNGTPSGIPNNAVAYFNTTAPSGWAQYTTGNNRVLKGAATNGDGGGTGGTGCSHSHGASHTHSTGGNSHSHSGTSSCKAPRVGCYQSGAVNVSRNNHNHSTSTTSTSPSAGTSGSTSPTSGNGDMTPSWIKELLIQNTSGANSLPVGIICFWGGTLASIPAKWHLCDGTAGTPNLSQGKYTRNSDTTGNVGTTGGGSHSHTGGSHTHSSSGVTHNHSYSATGNSTPTSCVHSPSSGNGVGPVHTHCAGSASVANATCPALCSASVASSASTSADPTHTEYAYIQYTG